MSVSFYRYAYSFLLLLAYKIVSETRNETCENTDDTIFSHELGNYCYICNRK